MTFPSSFWSALRGELSESYFRWQSDPRLRELCLALENKVENGVVRIVCAHVLPEPSVRELAQSYSTELTVDEFGVVSSRKAAKIFHAEVLVELIPMRV